MQLTELRIAGFKSFVDPEAVPIRPGLTGIVGPNGCGKSNLLEAMREGVARRDPVARFQLCNVAQVHKVHAGADVSDKGMAQSSGVMVNYLYDLAKVSQNHERFAASGTISASSETRSLSASGKKLLAEEPRT